MVATAALLAEVELSAAILRHVGQRSLAVYLAFFVPMVSARVALTRLGDGIDPGSASVLALSAGIGGALLLHRLVQGTPGRQLFERPAWARIAGRKTERRPAAAERLA